MAKNTDTELAVRRYFVHDGDYRAYSCYAGQTSTADMYLSLGFREVETRAEYLAFRRNHKPSGEHHVWFTAADNTAIARAAKLAGLSEENYIRACVHIHLRNTSTRS